MTKILENLFQIASSDPDRLAIETNDYAMSYGQLAAELKTISSYLSKYDVAPGTLLILRLSSEKETIILALGALMHGCPWTVFDDNLAEYIEQIPSYRVIYDYKSDTADPNTSLNIEGWRDHPIDDAKPLQIENFEREDALAWLTTSSGTNARPKFIGLSYQSLVGRAAIGREEFMPPVPKTVCLFKPIVPVGYFSILTSLHWGGTHVRRSTFDKIVEASPDLLIGSASQLSFLLQNSGPAHPSKKLPWARLTGGSVAHEFVNYLLGYFERVQNVYGATETGRVAASWHTSPQSAPIAAGKAYPNCSIEIVDENNVQLTAHEQGRIRIKSDHMVKSYIFNQAKSRTSFQDGWFYPGDLGSLNPDGELVISSRENDIINVGGIKLNPNEIDFVLMSLDGIRECLSFEQTDQSGALELAAILVIEENTNIAQVIDTIFKNLKKLRAEQVPKVIYLSNAVPRNENGKPLRHVAYQHSRNLKPIMLYNIILDIIAQLQNPENRIRK